MAAKAYILMETEVGKTRDVVGALRKVAGIKSVDLVTGPYDIIVVFEAENVRAVGDLVSARIHTIPGIGRTLTCLAI